MKAYEPHERHEYYTYYRPVPIEDAGEEFLTQDEIDTSVHYTDVYVGAYKCVMVLDTVLLDALVATIIQTFERRPAGRKTAEFDVPKLGHYRVSSYIRDELTRKKKLKLGSGNQIEPGLRRITTRKPKKERKQPLVNKNDIRLAITDLLETYIIRKMGLKECEISKKRTKKIQESTLAFVRKYAPIELQELVDWWKEGDHPWFFDDYITSEEDWEYARIFYYSLDG